MTNELGQKLSSPRFGKFQILEDQHACPFTHHKTIAGSIKRTAGALWIIIATRKCMHIIKGGHRNGGYRLLSAAREHRFGITPANRLPCLANGVAARSTGGNSGPIRSFCSGHDRDQSRRSVYNHHVDEEWADAVRPFFMQHSELLLHRNQ